MPGQKNGRFISGRQAAFSAAASVPNQTKGNKATTRSSISATAGIQIREPPINTRPTRSSVSDATQSKGKEAVVENLSQ